MQIARIKRCWAGKNLVLAEAAKWPLCPNILVNLLATLRSHNSPPFHFWYFTSTRQTSSWFLWKSYQHDYSLFSQCFSSLAALSTYFSRKKKSHQKWQEMPLNVYALSVSGRHSFDQRVFMGKYMCIKVTVCGLPWWRSGWESACQCGGHGFEPWSGKIPHATEQLGRWATITEPARLEPVLRNERGHDNEARATAMKSGPHLPQLERALARKRGPNTAISK